MPKQPERPLRLQATEQCRIVAEGDGTEVDGLLINISDEGFCIESDACFEVGQRIEIRVRGLGRLFGIVRWNSGRRTGGVLEPYTRGAVGS
jgi:hypothetical protein